MRHLNYNHLLYFWAVAREGSIAKASEVMHLTPQTISGQLRLLDEAIGERLFVRSGRQLVLSEMGHVVLQYANEIFSLGAELAHVVRGQTTGISTSLNIGIVDSIPKLITYRLLEPVLRLTEKIRLNFVEGALEPLLAKLSVHHVDLVLSDRPIPGGLNVRAYHHLLGSSGITIFGTPELTKQYRKRFPASLHGAPFLFPVQSHALYQPLSSWFDANGLVPVAVAEFDDSALMKIFGQAGAGLFAGPTTIESEICRMYHVNVIGRIPDIQERFYAITPERKLKHPAVAAITASARDIIFKTSEPATRTKQ
jgi:LysR family transcriptional regulator, transcriptional activator of nhaA